MRTQKGFTLIELMIVVAIIGILAAVAIPAYTDYMKRGKVTEAVQLTGGLKTPFEEYYSSKGVFPSDISVDLGIDRTGGKYTTDLKISATGDKAATFTIGFKDDPVLIAYTYALCYADGKWNCDITKCPSNVVPPKYLPSSCK